MRKCRWKAAERAIEYEVAGEYRYCNNVARHHKSNNVRLVVLVDRGVLFQMCHDQGFLRTNSTLYLLGMK